VLESTRQYICKDSRYATPFVMLLPVLTMSPMIPCDLYVRGEQIPWPMWRWQINNFTVAPNVCKSSAWNLLRVTLLAPNILRWLLHFWKNLFTSFLRKNVIKHKPPLTMWLVLRAVHVLPHNSEVLFPSGPFSSTPIHTTCVNVRKVAL